MAFELPTMPNFNTTAPAQAAAMPSPLEQYGKMLQLRALAANTQQQQAMAPLQQQQAEQGVQASTLENQQRQLELDSQKAMMKAWSDPDFLKEFTGTDAAQASGVGFDPNALTSSLINKGVLPKDAMQMTAQFVDRSAKIADTLKAQAQTGEANAAVREKTLKQIGQALGAIQEKPVDQAQSALDAFKQKLIRDPGAFPGITKDEMAHLYAMDLGHMAAAGGLLQLEATMTDFHKSQAEAATAPQKVIPPGGGLSPETQQQVQKDVAVATNPQVQQGKINVATAEGQARANIEAAMLRGSNAALAQVPPHLVAPATAAATKAGEDYAQAASVSDRLQAMMDAAKKGNVVSYQLIPQEGALQITTSQGVHRINMAEIQNYGGGSIFQRIEGKLGGALTGAKIPDSVLKDMEEMQQVQKRGAAEKYNNTLNTINETYGAKFSPVKMENTTSNTAATFSKTLSLSAIQQAAKDHGVSVDEAKRQAQAAGYTIQ